jgi:hypothetical protein
VQTNQVISIKSKHKESLLRYADLAAAVLSRDLGLPISRHAALLICLRRGLADVLGMPLPLEGGE